MNETDSLKGLIARARRERGTSVRQLAIQAKGAGFKIVGTTLNAIENGTYKSAPSDETLRAIAWLAGVADRVAFTAAGRRLPGPPFADELPPGVDDLSPKEREAVIGLLRVLIAQRQEISGYDEEQESRTEKGGKELGGTGSEARQPGAPIVADPSAGTGGFIQASRGTDDEVTVTVFDGVTAETFVQSEQDKDEALIGEDQGSQADHELAARKGETEDEIRERLGIPYE